MQNLPSTMQTSVTNMQNLATNIQDLASNIQNLASSMNFDFEDPLLAAYHASGKSLSEIRSLIFPMVDDNNNIIAYQGQVYPKDPAHMVVQARIQELLAASEKEYNLLTGAELLAKKHAKDVSDRKKNVDNQNKYIVGKANIFYPAKRGRNRKVNISTQSQMPIEKKRKIAALGEDDDEELPPKKVENIQLPVKKGRSGGFGFLGPLPIPAIYASNPIEYLMKPAQIGEYDGGLKEKAGDGCGDKVMKKEVGNRCGDGVLKEEVCDEVMKMGIDSDHNGSMKEEVKGGESHVEGVTEEGAGDENGGDDGSVKEEAICGHGNHIEAVTEGGGSGIDGGSMKVEEEEGLSGDNDQHVKEEPVDVPF